MNLGPNIWGPHLWKALHMITMGYPNEPSEEDKKNYKSFFENLYLVIPCSICATNYKKHLIEIPLSDDALKSKESLAKWVIDIHNLVNKETGKKILTHDEALILITSNFKSDNVEDTKIPIGTSPISIGNTGTGAPVNTNGSPVNTKEDENKKKSKDTEDNKFYALCTMIIVLVVLVMIAIAYKKN